MRKTLIASSVAVLALAGLAGGAVYAVNSDASPEAAPDTTAPAIDIFTELGVTPEQAQCLVANVAGIDTSDLTALTELMAQCGISIERLPRLGQSDVTTESSIVVETITSEAPPPGDLDPDTVTAVFALFDLDQSAVDCLVGEAEAVAPTDDATAEGIFITCGIGPLQVLEAIVALDAAAGDVDTAVDTPAVSLAPPESVTSSGNAMVDLLLEQLAARGINLNAEQGQCLLDNISSFDPSDLSSMLYVFEGCGIDVADVITGD
jgi:hypothetical protein